MLPFLYPAFVRRYLSTCATKVSTVSSTEMVARCQVRPNIGSTRRSSRNADIHNSKTVSSRQCYSIDSRIIRTSTRTSNSITPPSSKHYYSTNSDPDDSPGETKSSLPSSDPSSSSTPPESDQSDPWAYLFGEASPEEEESLKPKKIENRSFFPSHSDVSNDRDASHHSPRPHRHAYNRLGDMEDVVDDDSMSPAGPRANMTEREKVIFDMIFNKLLNKQQQGGGNTQKSQHARPSPMISALFESAVGPQRSGDAEVSFGPERKGMEGDKGSMQAVLAKGDFPASLRYAAAGAMGLSRKAAGLETDEHSKERLEEYKQLKSLLDSCENDLEIWEFLDTHVFSMAAPVVLPSSAALEGGDDKKPPVDPTKPAIPSSNYPKLLHAAISTLRTTYRDFPACISVFGKIKQLGPESYVIGCSISVYNEMLLVRWKGYRDIQMVVDLLDEMRVNGIEGNVNTAAIVTDVLNDIRVFESDVFLPGGVMMWQNGDVVDGKRRLKGLLNGLVREGNESRRVMM